MAASAVLPSGGLGSRRPERTQPLKPFSAFISRRRKLGSRESPMLCGWCGKRMDTRASGQL